MEAPSRSHRLTAKVCGKTKPPAHPGLPAYLLLFSRSAAILTSCHDSISSSICGFVSTALLVCCFFPSLYLSPEQLACHSFDSFLLALCLDLFTPPNCTIHTERATETLNIFSGLTVLSGNLAGDGLFLVVEKKTLRQVDIGQDTKSESSQTLKQKEIHSAR